MTVNQVNEAARRDPLENLPSFLRRTAANVEESDDYSIHLGVVDGGDEDFEVMIVRLPSGRVQLDVGCRELTSERQAREFWPGGVSRASGMSRPHHGDLITFVARLCDHRGWRWSRASMGVTQPTAGVADKTASAAPAVKQETALDVLRDVRPLVPTILHARIDAVLRSADPLSPDKLPGFIWRDHMVVGADRVLLGVVDGERALIARGAVITGGAVFHWGCREERSEVEARRHWRDGISTRSGIRRPHHEVLITLVAAVCDHRGWLWSERSYRERQALKVPDAPKVPAADPLLNLPPWVRGVDTSHHGHVYLGGVDGNRAIIMESVPGRAVFRWGCRILTSEQRARDHWRNNVSQVSGVLRPHAAELIELVAAVCRHRGWHW